MTTRTAPQATNLNKHDHVTITRRNGAVVSGLVARTDTTHIRIWGDLNNTPTSIARTDIARIRIVRNPR